jgi:hypothetical protein
MSEFNPHDADADITRAHQAINDGYNKIRAELSRLRCATDVEAITKERDDWERRTGILLDALGTPARCANTIGINVVIKAAVEIIAALKRNDKLLERIRKIGLNAADTGRDNDN